MKPATANDIATELNNLRNPTAFASNNTEKKVRIQTFGNFEVFNNGHPLYFSRSKAKEYMTNYSWAEFTAANLTQLNRQR